MGVQNSKTSDTIDENWTIVGKNMCRTTASFLINGKHYEISDLPADTSLNTFIREHAHLRGTKFMCLEGGCGACVVTATAKSPDGTVSSFAINSCLVPVYACHGWSIETIESLGDRKHGYHKVQSALASHNGSQCGYCSPGMVMNMYSLLKTKKELSMKDIENSFGGNICRCTGYRPILDAFKTFASDAPKELKQKCSDMEEISKLCPKSNKECNSMCNGVCFDLSKFEVDLLETKLHLKLVDGKNWYRVTEKREIFEIFDMIDDNSYMLVGGRTSHGVYRVNNITNYIDINGVPELHLKVVCDNYLTLGANVTLTNAIEFFNNVSKLYKNKFGYTQMLADHIDLIANVPVRNVGTIAGNLSIKNQHKEFPSDIFIMLEGVGARLKIEDVIGMERDCSLSEYLKIDMDKKLISKITLPALDSSYVFKSYKIMPRAQNAHAYVNAAFLFKVDKNDKFRVLEGPTILFGGITPKFVHAEKTECFLKGKQLLDNQTLQEALSILSSEVYPEYVPPDASAEYKKGLAISLLYKFILSLSPDQVSPKYRSGGPLLSRHVSSGTQEFETDKKLWPLNKPIPKLEAQAQCAGEAEYINDIKKVPGEYFAAVVVAKKATASSFELDPSEALKIPGVISFYSAKDIPGENDCMSPKICPEMGFIGEEVFASKKIAFAGQALGVILAETHSLALKAADAVKVIYNGINKPLVDFIDIINSGSKDRIIEQGKISPSKTKGDIKHTINGRLLIRSQYHYTMETQSCFCVPTEDGLDVYPSSQWPSVIQGTISNVLNVPENSINVSVRRLGGAYGAKISRNNQVSAICALAAHLSHVPVRLILSLETNMQMIGKRFPCYMEYKAGVNDDGQIQRFDAKIYQDVGATLNEKSNINATLAFMGNTYDVQSWSVVGYSVQTDTPSNTWARAPGSTEAVCCVEAVMEHIASAVKKNPVAVKLANMNVVQNPIVKIIDRLQVSSGYEKRLSDINSFNNENRWRKRGISFTPLNYPFDYFGRYHATVTVFGNDGTVALSHGGIECGQGLNTKVAQACAHILGIPLEFVKVTPTINVISPNNSTTGGSQASEAVAFAVTQASQEILKRLEPIRAKLPSGTGWVELIRKACSSDVDLKACYMYKGPDLKGYNIYAAVVTEVEIDILTGQIKINRVDILEDAGQSLSPEIDVGQIEGAFVMGLGYYLTEHLVYDDDTGKLLTDRTWNYKPPGAKDIPVEFHVQLLQNSRNPFGVLRSKATGEPPLNLSCSVIFAVQNALKSARKDSGKVEDWFEMEYPSTPEQIWLHGLTNIESMKL